MFIVTSRFVEVIQRILVGSHFKRLCDYEASGSSHLESPCGSQKCSHCNFECSGCCEAPASSHFERSDDTAMLPGHVEYCATMQRRCCDDRCSCCAVPLLRRYRCYVTYARRDRLRIVVDAVMIRRRSKDAATTQRRCCNYDTAAAVVL